MTVRAYRMVFGFVVLVSASSVVLTTGISAQQDGIRVHVELDSGPWQGAYDVSFAGPCIADAAGPGSWQFEGDSSPPLERVVVYLGDPAAQDYIGLSFSDPATGTFNSYGPLEIVFEVDDRGTTATIRGSGQLYEIINEPPIGVEFTIECLTVDPPGRSASSPAPPVDLPSPEIQGPAPAGSTVIDLTVGFGPWEGEYQAWTGQEACFVAEGEWLVTVHDSLTIPSSVTLFALEPADGEELFGQVTAVFGGLGDISIYVTSESATFAMDASGARATMTDNQATAILPDNTTVEGPLAATITCAELVP